MPRRPLAALALAVALVGAATATLTPALEQALRESTYVYVQSERKSGALSKPAEIWFMAVGDDVYVGTRPDSYRVKRIKAGRTKARQRSGTTPSQRSWKSSTAPLVMVTLRVTSRRRNAGGVSRSRLTGSAKKAKTSGRGRARHTRDSST